MPWTSDVSSPYCEIDFHTEAGLYSAQGESQPTDDLINVTTSKTIAATAGSFTINLVGHEWYYKLRSQDVAVIKMGRRPEALDTVMVGLINGVYRTRSVDSKGAVVRTTRIEGSDFGKVLLKAVIKWFPQFATGEFPIDELTGLGGVVQMMQFYTKYSYEIGSPAMLIKNTLQNVLLSLLNFQIKYYNNGSVVDAKLSDVLRFRLGKTDNLVGLMTSMSEFEGALWNYFTTVQNAPYNELFVDTRSDYMDVMPTNKTELDSYGIGNFAATFGEDAAKVVLFLRKTPFDEADWKSLKTHEVESEEVVSEDIGRSDHENYNVFLATYNGAPFDENAKEGMILPKFNAENIKRYGISYMEANVNGVYGNENIGDKVLSMGENLTDTLYRWYSNNIAYECGTLGIKGRGSAKIGQRLLHKGYNTVFYIEGVQQDFTNFGSWKTTLTLTRGQAYEAAEVVTITKAETAVPAALPEQTQIIDVETTAAAEKVESVNYVVKQGDSLWKIAAMPAHYGDGKKYTKILEANPQVTNPKLIYPGQTLIIPDLPVKTRVTT